VFEPVILDIANESIISKINLIKENNFGNLDLKEIQNKIDEAKTSISVLANFIINTTKISEPSVIKKESFSIIASTYSSDINKKIQQTSIENNISIVVSDRCGELLKEKFNIPESMELLYKLIEFNPNLNLDSLSNSQSYSSSSLIYEYINPETNEKLDTTICSNQNTRMVLSSSESSQNSAQVVMTIMTPNPSLMEKISINKYKKLKKSGVDMFDDMPDLYKTRCVKFKDPDTQKDTTPNYRIKQYYSGKNISCMEDCKYKGIDDNSYVICECPRFINGEERVHQAKVQELTGNSNINFDILKCTDIAFKSPNIFKNPAFYILGGLIILSGALTLILIKLKHKIIKNNLKQIFNNDCLSFPKGKYKKEKNFDDSKKKYDDISQKDSLMKINESKNFDDKKEHIDLCSINKRDISPAKVAIMSGKENYLDEETSQIENNQLKFNASNKSQEENYDEIPQSSPSSIRINSLKDNSNNEEEEKSQIEIVKPESSRILKADLDNNSSSKIGDISNDESILAKDLKLQKDNESESNNQIIPKGSPDLNKLHNLVDNSKLIEIEKTQIELDVSDPSPISRPKLEIDDSSRYEDMSKDILNIADNSNLQINDKTDLNNSQVTPQKTPSFKKVDPLFDHSKNNELSKTHIEIDNPDSSQLSRQLLKINNPLRLRDFFKKKYNTVKPISNLKIHQNLKDEFISPTKRDYQSLSLYDDIQYDKRSFCQIFKDNLIDMHIVLEIFLKVSIFNPVWKRVLKFLLYLSLLLFLNSLLFTDDLIDNRTILIDSVIL